MRGGTGSHAILVVVWLAAATVARAQPLITVTVGGGGSSRTDCLLVLRASANDPPDKPKRVTCTDGDRSCDNDGTVNGVCEFVVGACANSTFDQNHCTLAGVAFVTVEHAQDNGDPKFDTEFQALQSRISSFEFPITPDMVDVCTTTTKVHVVLDGPLPGDVCKRAKKEIKIVTQSTFQQGKSYRDTDKLQLTCNPAPGPCDPTKLFGGTFDRIQRQIFNHSCALSHCHDSQTHAGDQILDNATTSYSQIVNHVPNNTAAAALHWLRIDALNASPDSSFMYHKLTGDLPDKTTFGERMPRGRPKLDQFLIDILKLWIEAGAPQDPVWVPGTD